MQTKKYLKEKLQLKYKHFFFFFWEMNGKSDVICFRNMANFIVNDSWYKSRNKNAEEDSKRVVVTAAKLIVNELRSTTFKSESYPDTEQISDLNKNKGWLTENLRLFMETLIKNPLKQCSIGQAIVSAAKPRSTLSPILLAVGVEIDQMFGYKWQLIELSWLGFSVTPDKVTRHKQSTVVNENVNIIKSVMQGSFCQWSGDNVLRWSVGPPWNGSGCIKYTFK